MIGRSIKSNLIRSVILFSVYSTVNPNLQGREVVISGGATYMRAVESFPDPVFVDEFDHLSSTAQTYNITVSMKDYFSSPLAMGYSVLNVESNSASRLGNNYALDGYTTSAFFISSYADTGTIRWHYGFAALLTFATRSRAGSDGSREAAGYAVDTRRSQAYPVAGFTLFPKAPIRFSFRFLRPDSNLLYGWLRMQLELEINRHTLAPSFEFLNHDSFGKGVPNFAQPPGAIVFGYTYSDNRILYEIRPGFVINSSQGFNNTRVGIADRLLISSSIGYIFKTD